jgi:hypothetical protein
MVRQRRAQFGIQARIHCPQVEKMALGGSNPTSRVVLLYSEAGQFTWTNKKSAWMDPDVPDPIQDGKILTPFLRDIGEVVH